MTKLGNHNPPLPAIPRSLRLLLGTFLIAATWSAGLPAHGQSAFENVFGGDGTDTVLSIAPVATGYVVVGVTDSSDFPVTDASTPAGGTDLFVAKIGLNGTITAATRIGGSGDDRATGVVVDSTGLITVGGWTTSTNFPTVSPLQSSNGGGSDCLILQLDSNLVVQFATYLGGAGEEQFAGVTHQTNLDRFVFVGFTNSTQTQFPFPTPNGASADVTKTGTDTDGLLVALARDRTIPLATYHGISSGNEVLLAVDADPSGLSSQDSSEVAVTGYTDGPDFFKRSGDPLGSGRKLIAGLMSANTGARLNSRVRSGNGDDEGHSVAYTSGKIVVGGRTTSTDFPVSSNAPQLTHGGGSDGLFVAFETEDFFSVYSTYLGGSGDDSVRGLAYDPAGHLHFAGTTASTDFPVGLAAVTPARQPAYGGGTTDGITGRIDVTGTGFGGAGPAIATFPTLSYSGSPEEEGYLAAAHRPDGAGATGSDPYLAVSAGGRVVIPAPAPAGDEDGGPVAMMGLNNEQAILEAEGEELPGFADVSVGIAISIVPTISSSVGACVLTLKNKGQQIMVNAAIVVATFKDSQAFISMTASRSGDTVGDLFGTRFGTAPSLLPGESAEFAMTFSDSASFGTTKFIKVYLAKSVSGTLSFLEDSDPSNNTATDHYVVGGNARIEGQAYMDTNGNKVKDEGEPPAADAKVTHTDSTGGQTTVMTDASGNFTAEGVLPGNGAVSVFQQGPMGYGNPFEPIQTTPGETFTVFIPLTPVTPSDMQPKSLVTGVEGGVVQHWFLYNPFEGTAEVSENLIDWTMCPDLSPPVLLNRRLYGADPDPTAIFIRVRSNF